MSPATSNANFVEETTDHLSAHAANPRADIDYAAGWGDEDTADLYAELTREVDQQRYFLESHLRTEPVGTVRGAQPGQVRGDSERPGWALQSQHGGSHGQAPQRVTFTGGAAQSGQGGGQVPEPATGMATQPQHVTQSQRADQS